MNVAITFAKMGYNSCSKCKMAPLCITRTHLTGFGVALIGMGPLVHFAAYFALAKLGVMWDVKFLRSFWFIFFSSLMCKTMATAETKRIP
jgi:hypothetical protein